MRRYFEVEGKRLVAAIDVNEAGMEYSVEQVEERTGISGLREIDHVEFKKLKREYTSTSERDDEQMSMGSM